MNELTMPYASKAQRALMHIRHPEIAKRWDQEHPANAKSKKLPEHKKAAAAPKKGK